MLVESTVDKITKEIIQSVEPTLRKVLCPHSRTSNLSNPGPISKEILDVLNFQPNEAIAAACDESAQVIIADEATFSPADKNLIIRSRGRLFPNVPPPTLDDEIFYHLRFDKHLADNVGSIGACLVTIPSQDQPCYEISIGDIYGRVRTFLINTDVKNPFNIRDIDLPKTSKFPNASGFNFYTLEQVKSELRTYGTIVGFSVQKLLKYLGIELTYTTEVEQSDITEFLNLTSHQKNEMLSSSVHLSRAAMIIYRYKHSGDFSKFTYNSKLKHKYHRFTKKPENIDIWCFIFTWIHRAWCSFYRKNFVY